MGMFSAQIEYVKPEYFILPERLLSFPPKVPKGVLIWKANEDVEGKCREQ